MRKWFKKLIESRVDAVVRALPIETIVKCRAHEAVRETLEELDLDSIVSDCADRAVQTDCDVDRLVKARIDCIDISDHIDYAELAGDIDLSDLAEQFSYSELANNIDYDDLAKEVDLGELAGRIDCDDLAGSLRDCLTFEIRVS
jgi:hypothetical protein